VKFKKISSLGRCKTLLLLMVRNLILVLMLLFYI